MMETRNNQGVTLMNEPLFIVHCRTFAVARQLADQDESLFYLRSRAPYRTSEMFKLRHHVAQMLMKMRQTSRQHHHA